MGYFLKLFFLVQVTLSCADNYYYDDSLGVDFDLSPEEPELHEDCIEELLDSGYRGKAPHLAHHIVSVRSTRPTVFFGDNHFCAGSLVGYKLVLTAAHCLVDAHDIETRAHRLVAVLGSPNRLYLNPYTVEIPVSLVFVHPKFKINRGYDIALLYLSQKIPFDNPWIRIISLVNRRPAIGSKCTVVGWGPILNMGPYAADLIFYDMEILDGSVCQRHFGNKFSENRSLCVRDWDFDSRGSCRGELGAPLICEDQLAGIVSWGKLCDNNRLPSMFTDIDSHIEWFHGIVNAKNRINVFLVLFFCNALWMQILFS